MFELTGDPAYKATAALLWADIKLGWNEQQGGAGSTERGNGR